MLEAGRKISVHCVINGRATTFETYSMARLLDVLREQAGLTGTKEGCGEGECGACSIEMDGMLVNSCLVPALAALNLLERNPEPSEAEIREGLSGNLCRCTGYTKIFESIVEACRNWERRA